MYPESQPFASGMLEVGDGHALHWSRFGRRGGIPAVFLHGGPGAGSPANAHRLFDPARYDILVFDQRGAGQSRPAASLEANTTGHLVSDLEKLRAIMGVERWLLFGGSWGSTLALAYAQAHPDRVTALVLRGIFTARASEMDWIYRRGADWLFPEAWDDFIGLLDPIEREDPARAYYRRLTSSDPGVREAAAARWSEWEASIVQLRPDPALQEHHAQPNFADALARIEAHYMVNACWLEEGQLLRDADRLAGIPGVIVQGRYDACTPPRTAWELHRRWPQSQLVVTTAGHRFDEPETLAALVAATDHFSGELA